MDKQKPIMVKDLLSVERQDLCVVHRHCSINKFKNTYAKTCAETPRTPQEYGELMGKAGKVDVLILYKDTGTKINNGQFKLL